MGVPRELSEAARVDGASIWQEFRSIQLPLASPQLSALAILLFLWTWNQFLLPLVMVDDPNKRTMAGALGAFKANTSTPCRCCSRHRLHRDAADGRRLRDLPASVHKGPAAGRLVKGSA